MFISAYSKDIQQWNYALKFLLSLRNMLKMPLGKKYKFSSSFVIFSQVAEFFIVQNRTIVLCIYMHVKHVWSVISVLQKLQEILSKKVGKTCFEKIKKKDFIGFYTAWMANYFSVPFFMRILEYIDDRKRELVMINYKNKIIHVYILEKKI